MDWGIVISSNKAKKQQKKLPDAQYKAIFAKHQTKNAKTAKKTPTGSRGRVKTGDGYGGSRPTLPIYIHDERYPVCGELSNQVQRLVKMYFIRC
ncbi:hypothetical protein, partial [Cardiobacterium hominis]|uniref:hypothetical protein n=1 Tax=Cardiobacterium hominis TaxID=2718 RepID=UPI0028D70673